MRALQDDETRANRIVGGDPRAGMSIEEIAEAMNMPRTSAHALFRQASRSFRAECKRRGIDPDELLPE